MKTFADDSKELARLRGEILRLGAVVRSRSVCPRVQVDAELDMKRLRLRAELLERRIANAG